MPVEFSPAAAAAVAAVAAAAAAATATVIATVIAAVIAVVGIFAPSLFLFRLNLMAEIKPSVATRVEGRVQATFKP